MNQATQYSISKEAMAEMPMVKCQRPVIIVDSMPLALRALERLRQSPLVGIDTETKPNFRRGQNNTVALIQIATPTECYLFRINKLGFFSEMRQFLADKDVIKVGLSLKDDFHGLAKLHAFTPSAVIELQQYVRGFGITELSLMKIYAILFGQRISKGQRLSNWEAPTLTIAQQHYAAIDAFSCIEIYEHLRNGLFKPDQLPYLTATNDDNNT